MGFLRFILQDWKANKGNSKGRIILVLFRTANGLSKKRIFFYLGIPYLLFYKFFVEWVCSIEIPWTLKAGKNLVLYHGQGLVINKEAVIGENCVLRHCTTIGNKQLADGSFSRSPVIGNNVDIGSNVCIIGDLTINNNVMIGCGAIVLKTIRENCIAVGNPAVEKQRKTAQNEVIIK